VQCGSPCLFCLVWLINFVMSLAKNWVFTLNNYTEADLARIGECISPNSRVRYVLYGKEIGTNGTPHLQGFIEFSRRVRLLQVKGVVGNTAHVEVCRNVTAAIAYCKKDGDITEYGEHGSGQGGRSDLEEFKDAVKGGMLSLVEIREHHADVYARCPRFCIEYVHDHYPLVAMEDHPLRPWQLALSEKLSHPANRRTVIFIVDEIGNTGKSWFAHWYARTSGKVCQVMLPGKKADMAFALKPGLQVLFMDAPRSKQGEFIQYDFLEDLKNGYVFSTKYESRVKTYEPMHVVVCMNEQPDRSKLSADRFDLTNIRQL
jgi:hypothetical protein